MVEFLLILYFLASFVVMFMAVRLYYKIQDEMRAFRSWMAVFYTLLLVFVQDFFEDEELKNNVKVQAFVSLFKSFEKKFEADT